MNLRAACLLSFCFLGVLANGQDRCGTPNRSFLEEQKFESWMLQKQIEKSLQLRTNDKNAPVYTLPVVVHIIHNGEPVGIGGNLSNKKIQEQIDILNQDFRKKNPRAEAGGVPSVFQPVEADIGIEFALAIQNPNGFPTNGIVRKKGTKSSYSCFRTTIREESYWPAEDYINIWVSQINALGCTSFPQSDKLRGLDGAETNRLYDGVVIDADWWGINTNTGSFDSFGQTISHEMGHFLGLHHIWGDGRCNASDYCDDTPPAAGNYRRLGSPCTFPAVESKYTPFEDGNSCSNDVGEDVPDMFMNFMDYTNDECTSMFTSDQKSRIRTVVENSPRRLSLLTSPALETLMNLPNLKMAITEVSGIPIITCTNVLNPTIVLTNIGLTEITSLSLTYTVDGKEFIENRSDLSIQSGFAYYLPIPITNLQNGSHVFTWEITEVNGTTDDNQNNNLSSSSLAVQTGSLASPFRENFSTDNWNSTSPATTEWSNVSISSNGSMRSGAFDTNTEVESWLVSPVFDLSEFDEAGLFFRMSYGIRLGFSDNLELKISSSCAEDFQIVWTANLGDLSFPTTESAWIPSSDADWLNRFIDLEDFVDYEEVRLAFVFTNNGGNTFYLDDIDLTNNSDPDQLRLQDGRFVAYPNPAKQSLKVTVNLPETQPIRVQMIDMSGAIVREFTLENVLNKTFSFDTPNKYGMYFLRITGKNIYQTQRILISR